MSIFNLGSINVDHFYALPHLPQPGETLHTSAHSRGLGGKGMNQSVAASKAGAQVYHIGAIGAADPWVRQRIESYGVDCKYLREVEQGTGHAIIFVDQQGENTIILDSGANMCQESDFIIDAIDAAKPSDILLLQNETNLTSHAATFALVKGMRVIYSAAPFSIEAVRSVLPDVSMLVMNAIEASQLCSALETTLDKIPVPQLIVTHGENGAIWRSNETGESIEVLAPCVTAVDTTAAGDTYIGYVAAGLDSGKTIKESMEWASFASALKVTRRGTADAIPSAEEVANFKP